MNKKYSPYRFTKSEMVFRYNKDYLIDQKMIEDQQKLIKVQAKLIEDLQWENARLKNEIDNSNRKPKLDPFYGLPMGKKSKHDLFS